MLPEKLGKKRILLNDHRRCRRAIKGKILGRKMLDQLATLVTPESILRWHRELVAAHWDHSQHRKSSGRPPVGQEIVEPVLRTALELCRLGIGQNCRPFTFPTHQASRS